MSNTPILYDSHLHTPLCKHAKGEPEAYAAMAEKRGLKGIVFTCHNPGPDGWSPRVRMALDEFDDYVTLVERAQQTWAGRIDVRLGLESDYMPGMESWLAKLHAMADLEHVLGSVHPQLKYYKDTHYRGNIFEYQQTYFEHLALAAESGLFDTIAHPDLVKNVFPRQWRLDRLQETIQASLDRIAKTGVAMELNTSGLHKTGKEVNPGRPILIEMKRRDIPVVLGSDAHEPKRVAADFEDALDLLQDVGYTRISYFLQRQRHDISLTAARESLQ